MTYGDTTGLRATMIARPEAGREPARIVSVSGVGWPDCGSVRVRFSERLRSGSARFAWLELELVKRLGEKLYEPRLAWKTWATLVLLGGGVTVGLVIAHLSTKNVAAK